MQSDFVTDFLNHLCPSAKSADLFSRFQIVEAPLYLPWPSEGRRSAGRVEAHRRSKNLCEPSFSPLLRINGRDCERRSLCRPNPNRDRRTATRGLPERPDLRHLKDQAKDLLEAGGAETLSEAQFKLAQYGFASWPKLKQHVESLAEVGQLKQAIDANDLDRVRSYDAQSRPPRPPLGYNKNGPLAWAAECRGVACSPERLAIARWMLENGSDVHQGGDGPLMCAVLSTRAFQ